MTHTASPAVRLGVHAAEYARRGIYVFPLWWIDTAGVCACDEGADCGNPGKHPRVRRGVNDASANPDDALAWWHRWPYANIGIAAGLSRLAVIDVDPGKGGDDTLATLIGYCDKHGVDLLATRLVRTGSGGLHIYFREPAGGVKTAWKTFGSPGVDTRGRGGYVVAPPSLHASGKRYEIIESEHGLAPWPDCLTPLLDAPRHRTTPAPDGTGPAPRGPVGAGTPQRWAERALDRECEALRAMTRPDSGRNNALNIAAYKMGRRVGAGLLDEVHASDSLIDAASGWQGHTAREIEATVRSGLNAGKKRPHDGPTRTPEGAA